MAIDGSDQRQWRYDIPHLMKLIQHPKIEGINANIAGDKISAFTKKLSRLVGEA